jgi:hypothetical protein
LGRHVTEQLLANGKHTITALTRKESNATFPAGVKIASVDYKDESSLISALRHQDFLIITLAFTPDVNETHDRIVRAAVKAGVKHVMPNIWSSDIVLNNEALGDEVFVGTSFRKLLQDVEAAGDIAWTVLVTGLWYEFSLASPPDWLGFDLKNRKVTMFDDGLRKINMSTWPQQGRAVASFLSLKKLPEDDQDTTSPTLDQFRNKPLYVSSFFINQRSILDSVQRVTGTQDNDWSIAHESTSDRVAVGMKEFAEGNYRGMAKAYYARLHFPGSEAVYEDKIQNDLLGLPEDDVDKATVAALQMVEKGWSPDGQ